MLNEDTPENYINQLVLQVLSKNTLNIQNKNNIPFTSFNKKRKNVDKLRVNNFGEKLSNEDFKNQALKYFNQKFSKYQDYKTIISDAIDDYLIIENKYFNY